MSVTRSKAAALGQEAVAILEAGRYRTDAGAVVELGDALRHSVDGTRSYPPEHWLPHALTGARATVFRVVNASTLEAARAIVESGRSVVALNFASAKHPGGGFLGGARAQEESLARSSGLYASINGNPMYDFHRQRGDAMYTAYAIYSPDVPVFRADDGTLLDRPYLCSFITAPAVNAGVVLKQDRSARPAIRTAMADRVRRVLAIAAEHGHGALVLGAWGCGVFGNDCTEVADLFHQALTENFRGVFDEVVFAILDWSDDLHFIGPFAKRFASDSEPPA